MAALKGNEYQLIFSYLRSLNFHFLDTWVIECVNYYKSNYPNISYEELKNEVKQQWLLVNLREIKVPSLPPDLKSKDKIILEGAYAVQVESMLDSGRSYYSQLNKLLKVEAENVETSKKPEERAISRKRCLTFVLTDGVQEIYAMEYQTINKIKTNDPELLPGFKMVILGPVECRKGMILLKDENVRLCGGEVDSLTVTNKLKNLLIRKLGLDESDYPDDNSQENQNINTDLASSDCMIEGNLGNLDGEHVETLLSQNDDLFFNIPLESRILGQEEQTTESMTNNQNSTNENNEFLDANFFFDEDESNQENFTVSNKKHSLPQEEMELPVKKKLSLDPEVADEVTPCEEDSAFHNTLLHTDNEDIFVEELNQSPPAAKITSKAIKPVQTKLSSFFKNSNVNSDKKINETPLFVNSEPFIYLKNVMLIELKKTTVFTVKAVILTLKKKITIEKDEFNLKVSIADGSSCIDVDICSKILEDFLGFSPCEMTVLLKAKQTNSAIAQRIKESFSKAQKKLIHLNCLMKIKFFKESRCPLVLFLEEVSAKHLKELKERS